MKNESGIKPVEFKVLIKPIEVEEKTKGGIILPQQTKEREAYAQQEGLLVAVGAIAFTEPDWLEKPRPGDKVLFDKFAGGTVTGRDGQMYRLINDKEIAAVIYG